MKKPLFLNRRLYEVEKFEQNIYLHNKLNSVKSTINANVFSFNSEKDLLRGSPKIKSIFKNYIISFIYI